MVQHISIDRFSERGKELVERVRGMMDRAIESGRTYVETTRSTLEAEAQDLLGKVRSRSQELLHVGLGTRLEQVQRLQGNLSARAEALLKTYGPKVAERLPVAQPAVNLANTLLRQADERLKALLQGARATVWNVPIADYDKLTAPEVIKAIKKLDRSNLELVKAYETAHKARKTVLQELDALLAQAPHNTNGTV